MKFCPINNLAARKVLAAVKSLLRSEKNDDTYAMIESYVNCREQGFALCSQDDKKVAFSEFRRSDEIVVYFGKRTDFAFNTNIPSDEVYEKANFYTPLQIKSAAKFIAEYLRN